MNLHPRIIELLRKRGISSESELTEFFSEKPQKTYDPFLLLNMEAGVDLILSAIDNNESICIYGDYDADGITSTAILMEVLSKLTNKLTYYIPSRFDEGYGLNCKALDSIKKAGTDLVITVDCGSVSWDEVNHAKEIGLQIVVTDHHTVTDKIADCIVINPMQPGCTYPFRFLAGCGVAFKLAQAIAAETGLPKSVVTRELDLVGIGTIGDMVPLIDENRTLAKYGIRAINVTMRSGLNQLIEKAGLNRGSITSENISYVIVPHINAAGRMLNAKIAALLMMENDPEKVEEGVVSLIKCNTERKSIQQNTFEICKEIIREKYKDDLFYVIYLPDAHEGITGIVAGKLKESYGKPAIIVTPTGEGQLKGTGRGIEGINLYNMLKKNEDLFERFGGHAAACGFTMDEGNLDKLRDNLNLQMRQLIDDNPLLLKGNIDVDIRLKAEDVTLDFVDQLSLLEPFGCKNPHPVFQLTVYPKAFRKIGSNNQYTKFTGALSDNREIQCVIWNNADEYDEILQRNNKISIIGTLGSQSWNDRKYLQFTIFDVEEPEKTI